MNRFICAEKSVNHHTFRGCCLFISGKRQSCLFPLMTSSSVPLHQWKKANLPFSTDEEAAASKRMVIYAFSAQINLFTSFFLYYLICIWPIPFSCALRNSAFGLHGSVIIRHSILRTLHTLFLPLRKKLHCQVHLHMKQWALIPVNTPFYSCLLSCLAFE